MKICVCTVYFETICFSIYFGLLSRCVWEHSSGVCRVSIFVSAFLLAVQRTAVRACMIQTQSEIPASINDAVAESRNDAHHSSARTHTLLLWQLSVFLSFILSIFSFYENWTPLELRTQIKQ